MNNRDRSGRFAKTDRTAHYVLLGCLIVLSLMALHWQLTQLLTVTVYAYDKEEPVIPLELIEVPGNAEIDWIDHLYAEAKKHGADPAKMIATIECETGHTWDPDIQSGYYKDGTRENSWGLSQIFLDVHQNVTKAQATDPFFAISFMAEHFGDNDARIWTCYRLLFGSESSRI